MRNTDLTQADTRYFSYARRAYIDVTYSMVKCSNCRETFTLYYYQSPDDVASTTFPPWREDPYEKIDTVAAGNPFDANSALSTKGINIKTFSIGPLRRLVENGNGNVRLLRWCLVIQERVLYRCSR